MTDRESSQHGPTAGGHDEWPVWLCETVETVHAAVDDATTAPALGTTLPARLTATTPVEFAWIATVDEPAVRVRSAPAELPARLEATPEETLTARAESTGEVQRVVENPPTDVRLVAEHTGNDPGDIGAFVAVPLCSVDSCYGALHLWTPEWTGDPGPLASLGRTVGRRLRSFERAAQLTRERERLESLRTLVSHDLGNPVNIASGRVQLARTDEDTSHLDSVDSALEEIDALMERGVRLVEVGQQPVERERLSLAELARDSWSDVGQERGELVTTDAIFDGERERVRMLLNELVRNAFAHSDGEVTVEIGPLTDAQGFYVADDGPGIPSDEREYVIDTGYTTDADRDGIGLSIVTEIAGAHGWDVSLEPREPSGTRVEIIISRW
ncbi:Signal transduction histidine kinase [Halovenus aranensis]|uniref:histidine kinase n=1 Tax=Halovenus aranensis TaxID=890420 RepID=A0A1G8SLI4_9EURY|nr:HAMP domain-containing sensor histidine kinase [Halovenus aranensis]SDJ30023.1 Signal transduction histidine kinase [Halovenus aranensis]